MLVPDISVVVIAKNEADRIGRLLDSVRFAAETIVVDSGSSDGTRDLCRRMGARVVSRPWSGYADQKQFAMSLAASEWSLSLDADEAVSLRLADEIRRTLATAPAHVAAYSLPRLSRYLGRWIRHGGWYPDRKVRLVRRGRGRWEGDGLHERLVARGKVERMRHPILHFVYRDISDQIQTIDRFSTVWADSRPPAGGGYVAVGVVHALVKFVECFFLKRGLLDGIPGLVIAMNSSWYVFAKHAKAWERSGRTTGTNADPKIATF